MRSMVERHRQLFPTVLTRTLRKTGACRSTTFGGPPPRFGEEPLQLTIGCKT